MRLVGAMLVALFLAGCGGDESEPSCDSVFDPSAVTTCRHVDLTPHHGPQLRPGS